MRIEQLTIKNFRQYQNTVFKFPKTEGKEDIHIVLGNNGVGKTNMLNAIIWCLYAKETHLGDQNAATSRINAQYVETLRNIDGKIGEIEVAIVLSSDEDPIKRLQVKRAETYYVTQTTTGLREEKLEVMYLRNGEWNAAATDEEAASLIHRYVPEEMNEYIFFDGEQLEKYFQQARQRDNIAHGIQELTQSTILEKLARAFTKYVVEELEPKLRNSDVKEVKICQETVDEAKKTCEDYDSSIARIETQIQNCERTIEELDTRIKGHETIKEQRDLYYSLEEQASELDARFVQHKAAMMIFARENYVYFSLYPAMKAYYDYIQKQEKTGKLPPKIDKKFLDTIIHDKKCMVCGNALDEEHLQWVEKLQKAWTVSSATSSELGKSGVAMTTFFDRMNEYSRKKAEFVDEYNAIEKQIADNAEQYQRIGEILKQVPNNGALAKDISERDEYREIKKKAIEKLGVEKHCLSLAQKRLEEVEANLRKALEKNKQYDDIKRRIDYCKRCAVILDNVKTEILTECRNNMQDTMFNIFMQLLWKKDAFSKVRINENYTIDLLDTYGEQTLGSCSAAERALLALAFTLALQEISKHDSLLYIDTPIGRVDTHNRKNFIRVLLEVAETKQVILTFTPAEYDLDVRQQLAQHYSTLSELDMKDKVTTIKDNGQ